VRDILCGDKLFQPIDPEMPSHI